MKKIFQYSVLFVAVMSLVACGTKQEASDNGSVSNSKFEISVKDGMYIQPSDEDSSSHYLALQVEIKNNQDQKFKGTIYQFTLDTIYSAYENIKKGDFQAEIVF